MKSDTSVNGNLVNVMIEIDDTFMINTSNIFVLDYMSVEYRTIII